ncbi:hypothetical protein GCM10010222_67030 [Streptomyces tanashiensis]|nr:hypothetical protein GCM10010222_67030 [Streptomyces tanashiensis]
MDVSRGPAGRRYDRGGGEPESGEEPGRSELLRGSGHAVIFPTYGRRKLGKAKLSAARVHVKPVWRTSQPSEGPPPPAMARGRWDQRCSGSGKSGLRPAPQAERG